MSLSAYERNENAWFVLSMFTFERGRNPKAIALPRIKGQPSRRIQMQFPQFRKR